MQGLFFMDQLDKIYRLFKDSKGISTDSRDDLKGKLFFALSGENFDGNKFAESAIEKGAKAVIIDNPEYSKSEGSILVENSLNALQALANKYRKDLKIPVLAITGSNGKTTTKELIKAILSQKFNIHATKGNFNNHIGVPLTLLSCPSDAEFLLVEMGANHLKEIQLLCEITQPEFGVITNIGRAHLEGFGSFENIIKAKTELYHYLSKNNGIIILNGSDEILSNEIPDGMQPFIFNLNGELDNGNHYIFQNIDTDPFVSLELIFRGNSIPIKSNLFGDFNFLNIQMGVMIGLYFDVEVNSIKKAIEDYVPKNNRTEILTISTNTFVLDAYNANPSSMQESIKSFAKLDSDKILILGDMKELGGYSLDEHQKLIQFIQQYHWTGVFLIGEEFRLCKFNDTIEWYPNVEELKKKLDLGNFNNTHFLLKGSRSMGIERMLK